MSSTRWERELNRLLQNEEELSIRRTLMRIVSRHWSYVVQDMVFMHDSPTVPRALDLINKVGVKKAGKLIERMNSNDH